MTGSRVLVVGGAGYIGSQTAWALVDAGYRVVVLDNLSTGSRALVPPDAEFVLGDCDDRALLDDLLASRAITAVIHLAGSLDSAASIVEPHAYYRNNVVASLTLIEAAVAAKVQAFVFSSSAAVYAPQSHAPLPETAATGPVTPYGRSKLMVEQILRDAGQAHGLPWVALRYFNVAGADTAGRTGAISEVNHLLKVACDVALGQRPDLPVFGLDYPTPDGACIRDFIHVEDLAAAHLTALDHLFGGGDWGPLNCGYGIGTSVLQAAAAVSRVSGRPVPTRAAPRRDGDLPCVLADSSRLQSLGWTPRRTDLDGMVRSALAWRSKLAER